MARWKEYFEELLETNKKTTEKRQQMRIEEEEEEQITMKELQEAVPRKATNESTENVCSLSPTIIHGERFKCSESVIFEDNFSTLDTRKWTVQSYIPLIGPNYEFNSYEKDTVTVENSLLQIRPIPKQYDEELRGILDLKDGCTGLPERECFQKQAGSFFLPAIKSGRIQSKISFKYGKFEIKAKLAAGDWILSDIALIPRDKSKNNIKIIIAYARGNKDLVDRNEVQIGANVLFSGPMLNSKEPERTKYLKSKQKSIAYADDMHNYTYIWKPGRLIGMVDQEIYADIDTSIGFPELDTECYLSIGVAVGGNNDFPNGSMSGPNIKPWINRDSKQIKEFFDSRYFWLPTWKKNETALEIDYVKIYSA